MYMVQQRATTAVRDGYREAESGEIERQLVEAQRARRWLEGLALEPEVRAWLVEPVAAVEEALAEIVRVRAARADKTSGEGSRPPA